MSVKHLPERDDVAGCTDLAALNRWHFDAYDIYDDVRARIEAFRLAGTATDEWLQRSSKLVALSKITMRKVERRLIELGAPAPVTRAGYNREQVQVLRAKVRRLDAQVAALRGDEND